MQGIGDTASIVQTRRGARRRQCCGDDRAVVVAGDAK
jgi:hypothetical protein